jgi:hypothetical protein
VKRETGSRAAALAGAGAFAATFKMTDQFMDLARVDSLFVFFVVLALFLLRTRPSATGRIAAAVSLVLCFLTKQSAVLITAPLCAWVLFVHLRGGTTWRARLSGVPFAVLTPLAFLASISLLNGLTNDWFGYYTVLVPSQHHLARAEWLRFWTVDLLLPFGIAFAGALYVLIAPRCLEKDARGLWAAALVGVLAASWSARLHIGGWNNVMMPTFALLSALLAIALHRAFSAAATIGDEKRRTLLQAGVLLLGVVQLGMHAYDPRRVVPTERDEEAGRAVVAILAAAPGDVFVPTDSYLAPMAGKRPYLHQSAAQDLLRAPSPPTERLTKQLRKAFTEHRWSMVITDNDWFAPEVTASYERGPPAITDPHAFYPVTGLHFRPGSVFMPK